MTCQDEDEQTLNVGAGAAEQLFEMSLDNVCVAGFDGYFKRVNPSWTRTLGWTSEEFLARPVIEFVHPEDRASVFADRARLMAGETLGSIINRYQCKDGSYRWFEWRSVADLERERVYAVARDITEQKHAEGQLKEAQQREDALERQLLFADRMASVGTLAAGVAHEINNPLAFVTANIDMIVERLDELGVRNSERALAEVREMAKDVRDGAERIRKIVLGLKTFSRADEERLAVIDVRPLIERAIDMTINEVRHRARLVKDFGSTPLIEADESRLGQVIINLVVNASQAIPEGDTAANEIRIVTSTDEQGRAVIEVRDTGVGIPEEKIGRVFDPFFTTKPVGVGTGLGLSICHNIVAGFDGDLTVTSEEGSGSTFRIVLPAAMALSHEMVTEVSEPPDVEVERAAVLVVDDEPSIGRVLRRVLSAHDVTAVTTAHEGLGLLESGEHFDIIFSDLMMPEMSGMDFYREIAKRFPAVLERVVFVSGGAFTPSANKFLERVPNELVDKPFAQETVRAIVHRYGSRKKTG